jgi:hypothetical protein
VAVLSLCLINGFPEVIIVIVKGHAYFIPLIPKSRMICGIATLILRLYRKINEKILKVFFEV